MSISWTCSHTSVVKLITFINTLQIYVVLFPLLVLLLYGSAKLQVFSFQSAGDSNALKHNYIFLPHNSY